MSEEEGGQRGEREQSKSRRSLAKGENQGRNGGNGGGRILCVCVSFECL